MYHQCNLVSRRETAASKLDSQHGHNKLHKSGVTLNLFLERHQCLERKVVYEKQ